MSLRLGRGRMEDDYVNFFEMFKKSVKVDEMEAATGEVTALYMKDET